MANRYLIGNNWNSTGDWSTSSGGVGGAGVPTSSDDVFLDANSPNIDLPINSITIIKSLNCTGYIHTFTFGTGVDPSGNLDILSNCILSNGMTIISAPYDPDINHHADEGFIIIRGQLDMDGTILNTLKFNLYGTRGTIQNVTATSVDSSNGKKMYAPGSTLTSCINWTTSAYSIPTVHITNATELANIVNNPDYDYILDNDIDLTGIDWTPICHNSVFVGTFDGQGFTISNLSQSSAKTSLLDDVGGLFGFLGNVATNEVAFISNLNLKNVNIEGIDDLGALVGFLSSAIIINVIASNVNITTTDFAATAVGGLIGFGSANSSTFPTVIRDCGVDGVNITGIGSNYCGGFSGRLDVPSTYMTVYNCYAKDVNITMSENEMQLTGGFSGEIHCTISKCYASGSINMNDSTEGLSVQNCGGFAGIIGSTLYDCYAHVDFNIIGSSLTAEPFYTNIGGFVGSTLSFSPVAIIKNCYCSGNVSLSVATNDPLYEIDGIGGFVGKLQGTGTLINVYSVGIVSVNKNPVGIEKVGGFIGDMIGSNTITNCAWWTNAYSVAIGDSTTPVPLLATNNYGTDEPDHTKFFGEPTHAVYAQGT